MFFARVIEYIFSEVDKHIAEDDLLTEYQLSALPSLYDLFVKLVKYLVGIFCCDFSFFSKDWIYKLGGIWLLFQLDNKAEDRDQVVILFQDMLEVVTRDIMMEDHISK